MPPGAIAVQEANNRGVGHMERFDYVKATEAFAEVVKLSPAWLPGRINLGIALLNQADAASLERSQRVLEDVLRREPDNPYAHYCLGIMLMYQKDVAQAAEHFEAVARKDPDDPGAWYFLGSLQPPSAENKATECFRKALELSPNLSPALYRLAQSLQRRNDVDQANKLLEEFKTLQQDEQGTVLAVKYSEMGKYAEAIGNRGVSSARATTLVQPTFQRRELAVTLAPGARWATMADFDVGPVGRVQARVRERFGATVVVFDFDRDGRPDLFLVGAVVDRGKVRDLLLRNDGNGRFTDATQAAGLGAPRPTLGCCVGDFDNDGLPDLLLTGAGGQRLFRNKGTGAFEDATAIAGLDQLQSVCLGASWIDLDLDGDLDLVIAEVAANPTEALKALAGRNATGGGLAVFLNIGKAPAATAEKPRPPLECKFKPARELAGFKDISGPVTSVAISDLENDRDLDAIIFTDDKSPSVLLNDRLLRFRRAVLPEGLAPGSRWNGALVFDAAHTGRSDLFLVRAGLAPALLLNRAAEGKKVERWFEPAAVDSPPLLQAVAADFNLDGWTDVVGLSEARQPVLLSNDRSRLAPAESAFGPMEERGFSGLAVVDLDGTGNPGVLFWTEGHGLTLFQTESRDHRGLPVALSGRSRTDEQGNRLRCNADGFGARVIAQAGDLWAGQENTTLTAGLGQSSQPIVLGLGRFPQADVVRLRWPDGVWQAELNVQAGAVARIEETNRKATSCPILFAWDGQRFAFVTDFLGAGAIGEMSADGGFRAPRPEEAVKIEPGRLVPRDGKYLLKIAEPMDEITYLDRVQLIAIDHPADVSVYPDERFVSSGPQASGQLLAFRDRIFPARASDHRGRDATRTLLHWDRDTVAGFACRSWIGYAEDHFVELDFGDRLARLAPSDRLVLCLAGWTDYPFPESIFAATQAGVTLQAPLLERQDAAGKWRTAAEAGFPAGLPRMMTLDVTGKLDGPSCRLRLRTNMQVYWDQIFVAVGCRTIDDTSTKPTDAIRTTVLEVADAKLEACGFYLEYSPDGKLPTLYDHDRTSAAPLVRMAGRFTRYGNVTELVRETDDRFVIFGPGDALTLAFDATELPPLPQGWARSFVARTNGYCKDTAPFTAAGATVEPLPFRAMKNYPYGPDEHYPDDAKHVEYLRKDNTREAGRRARGENGRKGKRP